MDYKVLFCTATTDKVFDGVIHKLGLVFTQIRNEKLKLLTLRESLQGEEKMV